MNNKYSILVSSIAAMALIALVPSIVPTQHAFALKKFFACVTDVSNKIGGDTNLSVQDVINCFNKEFHHNHSSSSSDNHLSSAIATASVS